MGRRFALWAFAGWLAVTLMWWLLAFAPLAEPPVWLADARSVCFGTLPNGLPSTYGWMGLVASPLTMLAFLLAVWGRPLVEEGRRLAASSSGRLLLLLVAIGPLAGLGWVGVRVVEARELDRAFALEGLDDPADDPRGSLPADLLPGDDPAPELALVDQHGQSIDLAMLSGRPVLLTFAFAHCKTVCPLVVETVRRAADRLCVPGTTTSPVVVVVTLDPWRDTPSSLPGLATAWHLDATSFGGEAHVLSGEVAAVEAVLDAYGMPRGRDAKSGDLVHPARVVVLAGDGTLAYQLDNPSIDWLVSAVERARGGDGSPSEAFSARR